MRLRPLALVALLTVTTAIVGFLLAANIVGSTSPEQRRGQLRVSYAQQPASPQSIELRKLQLIEEVRKRLGFAVCQPASA
jgi:hypothetical protein